MTKQQIDKKLDELQSGVGLYNDEAMQLLEQWAILQTQETYKISTVLEIPKELIITETKHFIHLGNSKGKDDVLFLFPHTGINLPRGEFVEQLNLENWLDVGFAMTINRDAGTRFIVNKLIEDTQKSDFSYSIIIAKYNRNVLDANRLRLQDQVPDKPFKGISLWKDGADRKEAVKKLLDPFLEYLEEYIHSYKPKFIFQPHTYDTHSGESNGSDSHDKHAGKRPTNMIFNHYEFKDNAVGDYGDENLALNFDLLDNETIQTVQNIQYKHIRQIYGLSEEPDIPVDFPYVSPIQLCGLIKTWTNAPHLILENRKDLFYQGEKQIYDAIVEITKEVIQMD